jgi:hypothetical protein
MSINNSIDMSMSLDSSTKLGVVIKDGVIAGAIIETEVAPIKINATKPATEVTTESLTKIEMLTIKIML